MSMTSPAGKGATGSIPGTPMSITDPADEAGGEVVYSSDGLLPLSPTKPPPSLAGNKSSPQKGSQQQQQGEGEETSDETLAKGDDEGDDVLDSGDTVSPIQAFEYFSGKLYMSKNSGATPIKFSSTAESPLEKLARLQKEVEEIETELKQTSSNTGRDFDEEMVKVASSLQDRLKQASETSRIPSQDELTRLVNAQLQAIQSQSQQTTAGAAGTDSLSPTGIIYELYGQTAAEKSSAASLPTSSLEERLTKMEQVVGSSSTNRRKSSAASSSTSSGDQSLLARLEELEQWITPNMDEVATKAKVIRADLEAASKARAKLTSMYKKEDSKTILELSQQYQELQGISFHLPALTQRLQQLAQVHVQASTFATRLSATEQAMTRLESSVSQLESALTSVENGLVENIQTMQSNFTSLDERLQKLS